MSNSCNQNNTKYFVKAHDSVEQSTSDWSNQTTTEHVTHAYSVKKVNKIMVLAYQKGISAQENIIYINHVFS